MTKEHDDFERRLPWYGFALLAFAAVLAWRQTDGAEARRDEWREACLQLGRTLNECGDAPGPSFWSSIVIGAIGTFTLAVGAFSDRRRAKIPHVDDVPKH